jgi:uncharacterized protein (TIGR02147 family)
MNLYQTVMIDDFKRRKSQNPSYSMRSFARDLELSQSFLSQILSGKRKLSLEKAELVSQRLKLRGKKNQLFLKSVQANISSNPKARELFLNQIKNLTESQIDFKLLSENIFDLISDWYYFAIIELSTLTTFKNLPTWISRRLNISVTEAKTALELLQKVGLLKEVNGRLEKIEKDYIFENISSKAIRNHHHQCLDLAHKALDAQPMSEREFITVCIPMNPNAISMAKKMIRIFLEEFMSEMQTTQPKSVYKFSIQLFRLDQEVSNHESIT